MNFDNDLQDEMDNVCNELEKTAEYLRDKHFLNCCIVIGSYQSSKTNDVFGISGKKGNTYELIGLLEQFKKDLLNGTYGVDDE